MHTTKYYQVRVGDPYNPIIINKRSLDLKEQITLFKEVCGVYKEQVNIVMVKEIITVIKPTEKEEIKCQK